MQRSFTLRLIIVGLLTTLMAIPLFFASETINSRANYSRSTISSVSQEFGGQQDLGGPVLVIPVTAEVTRTRMINVIDRDTGLVQVDPETKVRLQRQITETVTEQRKPIYISPSQYSLDLTAATEERHRGLFNVPVYRTDATAKFAFSNDGLSKKLRSGEVMTLNKAQVHFNIGVTRSLRGEAAMTQGDTRLKLEPLAPFESTRGGLVADVGTKAFEGPFDLTFRFNGAQSIHVTPLGRTTKVTMSSDWPHPSFNGAFLPDANDVTDDGFSATWTIPHLSLGMPLTARDSQDLTARRSGAFGVKFYQPNDFYQKAFRAGRYGLLFIALTFLTVLLIERQAKTRVHPIQYLLIGFAQSLFVVLMVALAEQMGFAKAYLAATAATVGLITAYGAVGLKLGSRVPVLGAALLVIYAILYLILQAQDLALLAGSLLAFCTIAAAMYATKDEDWYASASGPGLMSKLRGGLSTPPKSDPS